MAEYGEWNRKGAILSDVTALAGGTMDALVAKLQQDEGNSGRTIVDANDLRAKRRTNRCSEAERSSA